MKKSLLVLILTTLIPINAFADQIHSSENENILNDSYLQRFFYNNYQLEIKQYHEKNNIEKIDNIINFVESSSKIRIFNDKMKKKDSDGITYSNDIKLNYMLSPNKNENQFIFNYNINYNKKINDKNSISLYDISTNIKLKDKIILTINEPIIISNKNYKYKIKIEKTTQNEDFFNKNIICKTLECEILKENTLKFRKEFKNIKNKNLKISNENNYKKFEIKKEDPTVLDNYKKLESKNYILYKVEKGDSLSLIAKKFNVPILLIKSLNKIETEKLLHNEVIVIKNKSTILHKIKKGETLYSLAKKFNITKKQLEELNKLKTDKLLIDKTLIIEQ